MSDMMYFFKKKKEKKEIWQNSNIQAGVINHIH